MRTFAICSKYYLRSPPPRWKCIQSASTWVTHFVRLTFDYIPSPAFPPFCAEMKFMLIFLPPLSTGVGGKRFLALLMTLNHFSTCAKRGTSKRSTNPRLIKYEVVWFSHLPEQFHTTCLSKNSTESSIVGPGNQSCGVRQASKPSRCQPTFKLASCGENAFDASEFEDRRRKMAEGDEQRAFNSNHAKSL